MGLLVLSGRDLEELFPAFIEVSAAGDIRALGASLARQLDVVGVAFDEVFAIERPSRLRGFADAARWRKQLIVRAKAAPVRLQGLAFERGDSVFFAMGHVLDLECGATALSHRDFSPADCSADAYLAAMVHSQFAEDTRRLAHELEHARRAAEAANNAKNAFMANMTHELRTPLNAIIGYSEMLREAADEEARVRDTIDLDHVLCAAKGLQALVTDVLDYTRLEERRSVVEVEPFDVGGLLDMLVDDMRAIVEVNGNRLVTSRGSGFPVCHGDEAKLYRCLRHLVANAARFTKGGEIVIHARVEQSDGRPWLVFEVADTGTGMSEDAVHQLMEIFAGGPGARDVLGDARLGLALTQRTAETLGGELLISSTPGKGSTFTLRAPVAFETVAFESTLASAG